MTSKTNHNKGCLASILQIFGIKPKETPIEKLPYRLRDNFLSPAELSFYRVFESVVDNRLKICAKVRLADIFYVVQPNKNFSFFNRISQRHVDFLLCQPETMKPILALELDDASHNRSDRQERDKFIDRAFKTARLPLIHIPTQRSYSTRALAERLSRYIPDREQPVMQKVEAAKEALVKPEDLPACPKCGSPMVLRTVKKGEHKGKQFYGCSRFPKCRGMLPR
jgi:hypothetical protein